MKDFFISYNNADRDWAEWIAWILEEAGYSVVIQAWDFRPGGNFVVDMHEAAAGTQKTIAVLSPDYLNAEYAEQEWAAALRRDPKGKKRTLIPIMVRKCELTGLLASVTYIDIVGLSKQDARIAIVGALSERAKPVIAPTYPGNESQLTHERVSPDPPQYPSPDNPDSLTDSIIDTKSGNEITTAPLRPDIAPAEDKSLSARKRMVLVEELNRLLPQQFNMIVYSINPPPGLIPSMPAAQADRTVALLSWAESPGGCGLAVIQRILYQITGREPDPEPNIKPYIIAGVIILIVTASAAAILHPTRTVELLVKSEPASRIYVDGVFKAETGSDGTFKASDIPTGLHTITLQSDCFVTYEKQVQFEYGKPVQVVQTATPKTEALFALEKFIDTSRWEVPSSWAIIKDKDTHSSGRLYVQNSEKEMGFARDVYFRNFKMHFQLRLENGVGAAWALRVKDPQNYYLFYLARPPGGSDLSYTLTSRIIIGGQIDPASGNFPPQDVPVRLTQGDEFTVTINAENNTIEHRLNPASTGIDEPIGVFIDRDNRFPCGGIGFLTVGKEIFSIDNLQVIPPNLKMPK
jgi:hypothetical protein